MIIGWEWVEIGICVLLIIGLILNYICMNTNWPEAVAFDIGIPIQSTTVIRITSIPTKTHATASGQFVFIQI